MPMGVSFGLIFLGCDAVCSFQRAPLTIHSTSPVADPKAHLRASGQGLRKACPRSGIPDFPPDQVSGVQAG